jgi:hypothetical protein
MNTHAVWEYLIETMDLEAASRALANLGRERWELVQIIPGNAYRAGDYIGPSLEKCTLVFKRPRADGGRGRTRRKPGQLPWRRS